VMFKTLLAGIMEKRDAPAAVIGFPSPCQRASLRPQTAGSAAMEGTVRVRVALFEAHGLMLPHLEAIIPTLGPYELVLATGDALFFRQRVSDCGHLDIAVLSVLGAEEACCALMQELSRERPEVRMLVLSVAARQPSTERVVHNGAACVLCAADGRQELATALQKLSVPGSTYFDRLVLELYRPASKGAAVELAERPPVSDAEMRVLKVVLKPGAAADKEIAQLLDLSLATVRTHLRHLYEAFGVSGRQGLIDKARSWGYHLI
jgi:DNA-binding NarL/FixJ family response regulator